MSRPTVGYIERFEGFEPLCRQIGREVCRRRVELGYSQEMLAEYSSLHRNTVSAFERGCGELSIISLTRVFTSLGVKKMNLDYRTGTVSGFVYSRVTQTVGCHRVEEVISFLLDDLRRRKGLSRETLSDLTGVHRNSICRLERGVNEAKMSTLLKIYRYFGIAGFEQASGEDPASGECTVHGATVYGVDNEKKHDILLRVE